MFVYALLLSSNKHFIDTYSVNEVPKLLEHSRRSEWVKQYNTIYIQEIYHTENLFEGDNLTKKYMLKYGIENVRGGSYNKIQLEEWQIKSLQHELNNVTNDNYSTKLIEQQYLDRFNNEEELDFEIEQMEGIRRRLIDEKNEIDDLKYVHIQLIRKDANSPMFVKLEIEPSIIDKYNARSYKGDATQIPWHIDSKEDLTIQTLYNYIIRKQYFKEVNHSNVVENIYKIYVSRVKKERQLTEILQENDCFVTDFDNSLILINKRIELLYEKYAKMI
jgi:hypothetical protein